MSLSTKEITQIQAELATATRELEIEAAVERIRVLALAMRKSEEFLAVATNLKAELIGLGLEGVLSCQINIRQADGTYHVTEISGLEDEQADFPASFSYDPADIHPDLHVHDVLKVESFTVLYLDQKALRLAMSEAAKFDPEYAESWEEHIDSGAVSETWFAVCPQTWGQLGFDFDREPSGEAERIIKRLAGAFDLVLTRFLDLQTAEAQAREAQIEAALERVRGRAMAMHESNELEAVVGVIFTELTRLDVELAHCVLWIIDEQEKMIHWWMANPESEGTSSSYEMPFNDLPNTKHHLDAWREKQERTTYTLEGDLKVAYDDYIFCKTGMAKLPGPAQEAMRSLKTVYLHSAVGEFGLLYAASAQPISNQNHTIVERFGRVFQQSYTRFLDVELAEAQTREAQIEAAVERVRGRALAMHSSDELFDVAGVMKEEMSKLDIAGIMGSAIYIVDEANVVTSWDQSAIGSATDDSRYQMIFDPIQYPLIGKLWQKWSDGLPYFEMYFDLGNINPYLEEMKTIEPNLYEEGVKAIDSGEWTQQWMTMGSFSRGWIASDLYEEPDEWSEIIHTRMAGAIDLAYQRFEDLKQAETQAREAQIEVAVERVRARALAMHSSEEILGVAVSLREELVNLNLPGVAAATICLRQANGKIRVWDLTKLIESEEGLHLSLDFEFDWNGVAADLYLKNIWDSDEAYFIEEMDQGGFDKCIEMLRKYSPEHVDAYLEFLREGNVVHSWHPAVPLAKGRLNVDFLQPPPDEMEQILPKMAAAFDLAYKRFEDLKLAEAQTREAQIGLAVERVRAKALAMHKSEDILNVAIALQHEMLGLGLEGVSAASIYLDLGDGRSRIWDLTKIDPESESTPIQIDLIVDPKRVNPDLFVLQVLRMKEKYRVFELDLKALQIAVDWLGDLDPEGGATLQAAVDSGKLNHAWVTAVPLKGGKLSLDFVLPPPDEVESILPKMAAAFDLANTRFEDLKKAEAQTREAQIGLAVERVRARALGMHSSEELIDVATTLREEMQKLGHTEVAASTIYVDQGNGMCRVWDMSKIEDVDHSEMHFDYVFDPSAWPAEYFFQEVLGSVDYNVVYLDQERLLEAEKWVSAHDSEYGNEVRKLIDSGDLTELWIATFPLGKGQLSLDFMKVPGEEIKYILPQLASAFDLAYKRFEDLRMAEEQALEAQIEAALERIRSRSMAMRQSSELESVVSAIFNELTHLEVELARCIMWIIDEGEETIQWWLANPEAKGNSVSYEMPFNELPNTVHHLDAWRQRREHTSYVHDGNLKVEFDDYIFSETGMAELPKAAQEAMREPDTVYLYSSIGDFGLLFAPTLEPISEEHHAILQRFGKVFQQSYTRFLDVQLAEAQAREAQIEAAMERIRSRAIAMQSSSELLEVAREMREQMELLDQKDLQACVLHLYEDNSPTFETFVAMRPPNDVGKILTFQGKFRSNSHESIVEMLSRYEAGEGEYTIELDGIQGAKWQAVLEEQAPEIFQRITEYFHGVPRSEYHEFWNFADFSGGSILSVSQSPPNDESKSLLRKAAVVFDLAYRRFLDLKEAEEATREAQIEAALERVRGQAMAMQDPEDIGETTLHLFDEIETLCDSVLRLGLGLYSDTGVFQAWLVGPGPDGGRALVRGGFRDEDLPVDAKKMITEWKKGNSYSFKETPEFLEWAMKIVFKNPDLAVIREQIRLEQYLTSYPHQTGFIYLVAEKPVTPEDPDGQIVTRFMSVFDLAYQRYNDLKQAAVDYTALLEEKSKTEQALVHLQATQRQLVEQEKLASLGALTAGIAHEIKNPLNFVNNFAEVSAELMDELADAVSKGDREEVKALLSDLKDNAGQIAKHGQRADSIVRSMMMHARGGTSEKETIDLNDFLEEYANLAWHGMRARDHGFQAEIERDLQDGVGSIQAQPQELGRVILNLLNNAFDAVKKQDDGVVIISTSAKDGNIEIRISDNGPGVPEDIREKIFEPFFTTKATGEGTGLGLSLSYDIITKGHGGTMTVGESECGGANFTISLPA